MSDYKTAMKILQGSKRYDFDYGTQLTVTGFHGSEEMVLDFENMTEGMFDELANSDTEYKDAMRILRSSKRYEFDGTQLTVSDYHIGDEVKLDLGRMTEEMYDDLSCEELYDDFEDAVNLMDAESEEQSM